MKVTLYDNKSLLVEPETEFEDDWLSQFELENAFYKHGMTCADFLGIKINLKKKKSTTLKM